MGQRLGVAFDADNPRIPFGLHVVCLEISNRGWINFVCIIEDLVLI